MKGLRILFLQGLILGLTSACSEISITESWDGGYKAQFGGTAQSSSNGLTIELGFDNKVDELQNWTLDLVYEDGYHFTLQNTGWVTEPGYAISFEFLVSYSGAQANVNNIKINGVETCSGGGGGTIPPPAGSACDATGTSPYDYKQALCMSFLFYEAQRSGPLPSDQRVTWRWDSALGDGNDVGLNLQGGYYDAGDHVKFGFPMAYTSTVLAWGIIAYEGGYIAAEQLDYARASVKWTTDYFLKAHSAHFTLYGQVGDGNADHGYWGRPEEMNMNRPSFKIDSGAPGSDLAGETAAALAAASIVFKDVDPGYSTQCLDAAKDLMDFADQRRGLYHESMPAAADFYKSWSGYQDELPWAALWLYKATGDSGYLDMARGYWYEFDIPSYLDGFDWDDKKPGVVALFAELDGGSEFKDALNGWTNHILNDKPVSPGGMVYMNEWGTLRHAANVGFILYRAASLGVNAGPSKSFAMQQLHYILGSNGRSFVVGFGNNPPQRPHHRSSSCPDPPASCTDGWAQNQGGPNPQVLFGALVGGPDQYDNYSDDRSNFVNNEVACDYNAGFTGLLAAAISDL